MDSPVAEVLAEEKEDKETTLNTSPEVETIVTGFGKFMGVHANPTSELMQTMDDFLLKAPLASSQMLVRSFSVLHVSGKGCQEDKSKLTFSDKDNTKLWLHLGVDASAKVFKIEAKAFNMADFRCPDEHNWQPEKERIIQVGRCLLHKCMHKCIC